jgi:hypothetical protein
LLGERVVDSGYHGRGNRHRRGVSGMLVELANGGVECVEDPGSVTVGVGKRRQPRRQRVVESARMQVSKQIERVRRIQQRTPGISLRFVLVRHLPSCPA